MLCIGEIMKNPEIVGSNLSQAKVEENFATAKEKWKKILQRQRKSGWIF